MKRLCLLIITVLLSAVLCACAPPPPDAPPAATPPPTTLVGDLPVELPLVDQPQTLKILITGYNGKDQSQVYVWQKYAEMSGVDVEWTTVTKETRSEAVHAALTNAQQYDLILRCKLSATRLLRYGSSGLLLDLAQDGLLQRCAPNCWAYLQQHPDALAAVMNPDGSIYALPQVNAGAELRVAQKIYINKRWLEQVDMQPPTSIDELAELLLAFKQQDANANGDPDDEIPLSSAWDAVSMALYGAYGLANRGFHNPTVDCDPQTGQVRLIEGSQPYREFLTLLRDFYAQGLLDKNFFTLSLDELAANIARDRVGVFVNTNLALLPPDAADDWLALDQALVGPHGDQLWSAVRANFHSSGAAALPATCSDPELALRWLDYFWTDAGTLFYHLGVEGETYQVLADGSYDYLPALYQQMSEQGRSFDDVVSDYSPYPGGSNPTVEIAPYFRGGEMADVPAQAARGLMAYGPQEYWPEFTFTAEENSILDAYKGDLNKYCQAMRVDFVLGARSLDEWDSYTAQLEQLGAAELRQVYQTAADRYHALRTALN